MKIARETATAAHKAVDAEAANVSCKRECLRKQGVADKADAELKAALAEAATVQETRIAEAQAAVTSALAAAETEHAQAIAEAQAAYEALPVPPSATPLADRTGIPQWMIDLALAGGAALAAVVLAACLVAHGASPLPATADPEIAALRTHFATPLPDRPDAPMVAEVVRLSDRRGPDRGGRRGPNRPDNPDRPKRSGPSGGLSGLSKADAFDDLMQRLADGRTIGSQDDLASDWHRPKQTVSDWMREWRRSGVVPQAVQSGRCKVTMAV